MNCHAFRQQHLDYTEHALTAAAEAAAQGHLETCARCARFDFLVRRGLFLVRNLPPAAHEVDLYPRIAARLAEEAAPPTVTSPARRRTATVLIAAATAAFAAGVILSPKAVRPALPAAAAPSALAPLASIAPPAELPQVLRADVSAAAFSGLPFWPTATLPDDSPIRFAGATSFRTSPAR
jgi:hypothetical protein